MCVWECVCVYLYDNSKSLCNVCLGLQLVYYSLTWFSLFSREFSYTCYHVILRNINAYQNSFASFAKLVAKFYFCYRQLISTTQMQHYILIEVSAGYVWDKPSMPWMMQKPAEH